MFQKFFGLSLYFMVLIKAHKVIWLTFSIFLCLCISFFLFFKFVYLFVLIAGAVEGQRERERERERQTDGEREDPKQALCCQFGAWCGDRSHKLWDHNLSWNQESDIQLVEPPRHPYFSFISCFKWMTVVGFLFFTSVWIRLSLNEAFSPSTVIITLILDYFLPSCLILYVHSTFFYVFFAFFLLCYNLVCVIFL